MELTQAVMNIDIFIQRLLPLSLVTSEDRTKIIKNPQYKKVHRIAWQANVLGNTALCCFSIFQIFQLQFNSVTTISSQDEFQWKTAEKGGFYFMVFILNFAGIAAYYTLNNYANETCFVMSQSLKLVLLNQKKHVQDLNFVTKMVSGIKSTIVYCSLGIPLFAFILLFGAPFLRPYDPVRTLLNDNNDDISWFWKFIGSLVLGNSESEFHLHWEPPSCISV